MEADQKGQCEVLFWMSNGRKDASRSNHCAAGSLQGERWLNHAGDKWLHKQAPTRRQLFVLLTSHHSSLCNKANSDSAAGRSLPINYLNYAVRCHKESRLEAKHYENAAQLSVMSNGSWRKLGVVYSHDSGLIAVPLSSFIR